MPRETRMAAPGSFIRWFGLPLRLRLYDTVTAKLLQRYLGPLHGQCDTADIFSKRERAPSEEELFCLREYLARLGAEQNHSHLEIVIPGRPLNREWQVVARSRRLGV